VPRIIDRCFPFEVINRALRSDRHSADEQDGDLRSWFSPVPDLVAQAILLACALPSTGVEHEDRSNLLLLVGVGPEAEQLQKQIDAERRVRENTGISDLISAIGGKSVQRGKRRRISLSKSRETYEREAARRVGARIGLRVESLGEIVLAAGDQRYGRIIRYFEPMAGVGGMALAASRLGMSVVALELHPIGAIGGTCRVLASSKRRRSEIVQTAAALADRAAEALFEIDDSSLEDGSDVLEYVYAMDFRDPTSSYWTPILPTFLVSKEEGLWLEPVPNPRSHQVDILLRRGGSPKELQAAERRKTWGPSGMVSIVDIDGALRSRGEELSVGRRHVLDEQDHWRPESALPQGEIRERLIGALGATAGGGTRWLPVDRRLLSREEDVITSYEARLAEWLSDGTVPDEPLPDEIRERGFRGWTRLIHLYHPRHLWPRAALLRAAKTPEEWIIAAWMIACTATRDSRLSSFGTHREGLLLGDRARGRTTMFTVPSWKEALRRWRSFLPEETPVDDDIMIEIADAASHPFKPAEICLIDFRAPGGPDVDAEIALSWAAPALRKTTDDPAAQRKAGDARAPLRVRSPEDMSLLLNKVRPDSFQRLLVRTDGCAEAPRLVAEAQQAGWKIVASWVAPGVPGTTRLWVFLPRDRGVVGYRSEFEAAVIEAESRPETAGRLVALLSVLSSYDRIVGEDIQGAIRGTSGALGAAIRSASGGE
jgi:hypothetical protein